MYPLHRYLHTVLGPLNGLRVCAQDGLEGRQTLKASHALALHVAKTFFRFCRITILGHFSKCVFSNSQAQPNKLYRTVLVSVALQPDEHTSSQRIACRTVFKCTTVVKGIRFWNSVCFYMYLPVGPGLGQLYLRRPPLQAECMNAHVRTTLYSSGDIPG